MYRLCGKDEFSDDTMGVFDRAPYFCFDISADKVRFDALW